MGKTRIVWLVDGEKSLTICSAVSTQYWRVTDGQTDRQTSCDSIGRAVPRIAVKTIKLLTTTHRQ